MNNSLESLYHQSIIGQRTRDWSFLDLYENDVIDLYNQGFGIANIANKVFISNNISLNVKRSFVNRILDKNGIQKRTQHEQTLLDYQTGVKDRFKQTKKANIGMKNWEMPLEQKIKHAQYEQSHPEISLKKSKYEKLLYDYLIENNIAFEYQKQFQQYNVDFVFDDLAVELTGGHFRDYNDNAFNEKRKYLLSHGIDFILIIRCSKEFDAEQTYNKIIKNFLDNKTLEISNKGKLSK